MIDRLVLFGASGDLTSRLLMPAIAELVEAGLLPAGFRVVGASTAEWSTEHFREHIAHHLDLHAPHVAHAARAATVDLLSYRAADIGDRRDVAAVIGTAHADTLVYLALPPSLIEVSIHSLSAVPLAGGDAVAIEKPFGMDLASARHLNGLLRTVLPSPTILRIDHFLSSELVRRVLALRSLNRVFGATWNAEHIERVDISWLESLTLEGRAAYYDRAGALKDMVQNHLLEVLAVVAMEQPARLDADSIRTARVEVLRAVATPSPTRILDASVRARYTRGTIAGRAVPSYVDEPGVEPARGTETYAAITLDIDNPRWAGVPFTLRSGKAAPADDAEIAVHYRPLPRYLREWFPDVAPNVLRLGLLEPVVELTTTINGPDDAVSSQALALRSAPARRGPYANLMLDMLNGDPTLTIRSDEAEEAWRIIDPVLGAWAAGDVPMLTYAAGAPPPR